MEVSRTGFSMVLERSPTSSLTALTKSLAAWGSRAR